MSDTNRHLSSRRLPASVAHTSPHFSAAPATPSARVEALRRLVAAGQYQLSPKWIAHKICRAAGITMED
jgi:anti-sigma28 factor (negative regulator of flagellin synthesis)